MPDLESIRAFLLPRHVELAAKCKAFAREQIAPLGDAHDDDAARIQARQVLGLLGAGSWFDSIEAQDFRACALIRETLACTSPLADAVFALQALGSTPLFLKGTDAQKQRWIPKVLSGEAMAAFALTEEQAGSDVQAMATRAIKDGDDYVLTGEKWFISNAGTADFYTLFAVTDPDRGSKSVSAFCVPADAPGLEFRKAQVMSVPHPLGIIGLDDCRVGSDCLLGSEGDGLKIAFMTLDRLRATVAAAACGMGERALFEALAHARERKQFGNNLGTFQLVQQKLARMGTDLKAARLLTYQAVYEKDEGKERVTVEAAMAKAFATEAAQRIVDDAVQILGGRGVLSDHPVDHLYRSVRALRIYEGTTEIQHLIIAGRMLDEEKP